MKGSIWEYASLLLMVGLSSYIWKYGSCLIDAVYARGSKLVLAISRKLQRKSLNSLIFQRMLQERFETWRTRGALFLVLCGLMSSSIALGSDFATRCAQPGVVKCISFDSAADITGTWGTNSQGVVPKGFGNEPSIDTSTKISGAGSMKMVVPAGSVGGVVGDFFANFSSDYSVQFDSGDDFYVQWRQRFDSNYVTATRGIVGMKQGMVGSGSTPTTPYSSCSDLELVTQNSVRMGVPQMYNNCGRYDNFHQGAVSQWNSIDYNIQNARPFSPGCWYYAPDFASRISPLGNCVPYYPNEWMTFKIHVHLGTRTFIPGSYWFVASHVDQWVAREGEASIQTINWGPYDLGGTDASQKYGQLWLLVYSGNDVYPSTSSTWYDDVIISRNDIADPLDSSSPTLALILTTLSLMVILPRLVSLGVSPAKAIRDELYVKRR